MSSGVGNVTHTRMEMVVVVIPEKSGPASAHQQVLDRVVDALLEQSRPPVQLIRAPWPLSSDDPGIGDDVHRALLADDWADSGMRAGQLKKLIEVQVVARKRQYSAEHSGGRDVGIQVDGDVVGRLLLDLDDDTVPAESAPIVLVDIAVHPERQRQGIGGEVLRALLATAAATDRPVELSALFGTPALRWYLGLGFVDVGGDALYRRLAWKA